MNIPVDRRQYAALHGHELAIFKGSPDRALKATCAPHLAAISLKRRNVTPNSPLGASKANLPEPAGVAILFSTLVRSTTVTGALMRR